MDNFVDVYQNVQRVKHPEDSIYKYDIDTRRFNVTNNTIRDIEFKIVSGDYDKYNENNFNQSKSFLLKPQEDVELAINAYGNSVGYTNTYKFELLESYLVDPRKHDFSGKLIFQWLLVLDPVTKKLINSPVRIDENFNTAVINYDPDYNRAWIHRFKHFSIRR